MPVSLEGGRITGVQVNKFRQYIETLARSQIYNKSVWTNNIDEFDVKRLRPAYPRDTGGIGMKDALREAFDPQRFNTPAAKVVPQQHTQCSGTQSALRRMWSRRPCARVASQSYARIKTKLIADGTPNGVPNGVFEEEGTRTLL